jgi:hypothetical protein
MPVMAEDGSKQTVLELRKSCLSEDSILKSLCDLTIDLSIALYVLRNGSLSEPPRTCPDMTTEEAKNAFLLWSDQHPDELETESEVAVMQAYAWKLPCTPLK